MDLSEIYLWAAQRLTEVRAHDVAERLVTVSSYSVDRRPICVAIMAAIDGVDLRRAATTDTRNADRWLAVAEDQAKISRAALAVCGVREVAR